MRLRFGLLPETWTISRGEIPVLLLLRCPRTAERELDWPRETFPASAVSIDTTAARLLFDFV